MVTSIQEFIKKESFAGILLIFVTLLALILQNSFLSAFYSTFLHIPIQIGFGDFILAKPLILWVNDGLMAIFFFLIGLEVKREILEGELSSIKQVGLPFVAAVGGMVVPALIFTFFNYNDSFAMKGWAIPTATDIAFALGILALLGSRIPSSLKVFLMALAIIDDLGAIVIIALFYTHELSFVSLAIAGIALCGLVALNYLNVTKKWLYIIVGTILWVSVLKSGVHATIAGVLCAFTIPLRGQKVSMLKEMEHAIHPWSALFILPLFAFVNAGVELQGVALSSFTSGVSLGIMLGLFVGKQLGVFLFSYVMIKCKFVSLPSGSSLKAFYGVTILTGIGFTMSLFIDGLAYQDSALFHHADKLAIFVGSFLSGAIGYLFLKRC